MVDLKATNLKLRQRSRNILRAITGPLCPGSDSELDSLLIECGGSVKLAAAKIILNTSVPRAIASLERNHGVLAKAMDEAGLGDSAASAGPLVLCVDAGGSSCKAVVKDRSESSGFGVSGPCNVYAGSTDCLIFET